MRTADTLEPCMCVTRIRMCEVYAQCMYTRKMCVQQVSVCTGHVEADCCRIVPGYGEIGSVPLQENSQSPACSTGAAAPYGSSTSGTTIIDRDQSTFGLMCLSSLREVRFPSSAGTTRDDGSACRCPNRSLVHEHSTRLVQARARAVAKQKPFAQYVQKEVRANSFSIATASFLSESARASFLVRCW